LEVWSKILDMVWRLRTVCKYCVVDLSLEHNAICVDIDFTTAVETLRLKWLRAGSGDAKGTDETGFVN
jgi:hypothetical protein